MLLLHTTVRGICQKTRVHLQWFCNGGRHVTHILKEAQCTLLLYVQNHHHSCYIYLCNNTVTFVSLLLVSVYYGVNCCILSVSSANN